MNRREMLGGLVGGGVAWLGGALTELPLLVFAEGEAPPADVLVVVFQRGGVDGLSLVAPYGEGRAYYDPRPSTALPEPGRGRGALHDLDGFFGLHPRLEGLMGPFQAGHLAVVHATGSPDPSRSHFDAMESLERGTPGSKRTPTGWVARHLESTPWTNPSPFRAVGMGSFVQSALRGPVPAMSLRSIAEFHLVGREEQLGALQRTLAGLYGGGVNGGDAELSRLLAAGAGETLRTVTAVSKLAAEAYTPAHGAQYPDSPFGWSLREVAQLIKADVGLEVACVDAGGWDTHESQGGAEGWLAELIGDFGAGLGAFYTDLQDEMARVVVVSMSEFGRRVQENASGGTDHGRGNAMLLLGGGVRGGVYARWPGLYPDALDEGDLAVTTDYRDVLGEVLLKRLGNRSLGRVFPGYTPSLGEILEVRRA